MGIKKFFKKVILVCVSFTFIFNLSFFFFACDNKKETIINVYTIQPWYDEMVEYQSTKHIIELPQEVKTEAEFITKAAENLADAFDFVKYSSDFALKGKVLEIEDFKKIGSNQIVLFQGHASFSPDCGSVIWNKNEWDFDKEENDEFFRSEYLSGRIVNAEYKEAYSAKFIDKYCGKMNNTVIYLGQCLSGKDYRLANAFIKKGAVAVIGYTDTVEIRYGDIMLYESISALSKINPETGDYYTLYEAVEYAKSLYGESDEILFEYANGGAPIIYGNGNYRIKSVK